MAATAYTICRHKANVVQGVALGATVDDVVVTIQDEGVVQYSIASKEARLSWGLGSEDLSFRTRAVYNTAAECYHTVVYQRSSGADVLLSWRAASCNGPLEKISNRIPLQKAVHALHPISCVPDGDEPRAEVEPPVDSPPSTSGQSNEDSGVFIVFKDGTVGLGNFYTNGWLQKSLGRKGRVLATSWYQGQLAVVTWGRGCILTLATYVTADGKLFEAGRALLQAPEKAKLASISLRGQELSVVWAEGTVQMYALEYLRGGRLMLRLQATCRMAGCHPPTAAKVGTRRLCNGHKNSLGVKRQLAAAFKRAMGSVAPVVLSMSEDLVAVVSYNWRSPSKLRLTVLDKKYGTVRCAEELPCDLTSRLQAINVGQGGRQLAIVTGGSVLITNLQDSLRSLASLVGSLSSQSSRNPFAQAARAALHPDSLKMLQPPPKRPGRPRWFPRLDDVLTVAYRNPRGYAGNLAVPMDPRDNGGAAAHLSSEELAVRRLRADIESSATYVQPQVVANLVKRVFHVLGSWRRPMLPLNFVGLLLTHLADKGFWKELKQLLRYRALRSLTEAPHLATLLAQKRRHHELALLLPKAKNLPLQGLYTLLRALMQTTRQEAKEWHRSLRQAAEQAVARAEQAAAKAERARTARFAFTRFMKGEKALLQTASAAAAVLGFAPQDAALHPLLAMRVDSEVLLAALQKLPVKKALRLARYLLTWISHYTDMLTAPGGFVLPSGAVIPPLGCIVQWASLLLDAHLTNLAMLPAATQLVRRLQGVLRRQLRTMQRMTRLRGPLEHIRCRAPLPIRKFVATKEVAKLYAVEVLDERNHAWDVIPLPDDESLMF